MVIQRLRMALADAIPRCAVRQVARIDAGARLTSLVFGSYVIEFPPVAAEAAWLGLLDEDLA
jgi:hypothetical protein